ncbi:hypothetical protein [Paenibacillus xerothermodurans]|uniref:Uncharacterized protein n=1 Tax=Paenibacillus xerothermodurans TaxID=1977292 RepID=A0A2W1NNF7_PAEXE|nr:hypothetical protein [Paenibacillus xerothermodurans]PZE20463.1 hypothetical protein CBW46_013605 [Paenibacillus xerothermodurans]
MNREFNRSRPWFKWLLLSGLSVVALAVGGYAYWQMESPPDTGKTQETQHRELVAEPDRKQPSDAADASAENGPTQSTHGAPSVPAQQDVNAQQPHAAEGGPNGGAALPQNTGTARSITAEAVEDNRSSAQASRGSKEPAQASTTAPAEGADPTSSQSSAEATTQGSADAAAPNSGKETPRTPPHTTAPAPSETPPSDQTSPSLKSIESKYFAQMQALKARCQGEVNAIVSEIAGATGGGTANEDFFKQLQSKYLTRIADAEAGCRSEASAIIQKAKSELTQAGLDDSGPDSWRQEYESAKNEAQSRAIGQLQQQLNKK